MADLPKSGSECEHNFQFIKSSRGVGTPISSESISVCKHCGLFNVTVIAYGQFITTTFWLTNKELVESAGRYMQILEADTGYPGDDASPEPPNADYWSEG